MGAEIDAVIDQKTNEKEWAQSFAEEYSEVIEY